MTFTLLDAALIGLGYFSGLLVSNYATERYGPWSVYEKFIFWGALVSSTLYIWSYH